MSDRLVLDRGSLLPVAVAVSLLSGAACSTDDLVDSASQEIRAGRGVSNYQTVVSTFSNALEMGSATNARYPRCFVSAAHVGDVGLIIAGPDDSPKSQTVARNAVRPDWAANLGKDGVWIDLRVFWANNVKGADKIVEPAGYSPVEPAHLGLTSTKVDATQTPKGPAFDPPPAAWLQGYGQNANNAGLGILREGLNWIYWYIQGSLQDTARAGSFYIVEGENACDGDSGGPAFFEDGTYFGVISQGRGNDCTTVHLTGVTGFDDGAPNGGTSNWAWLDKTIEKTCSKKVDANPGCGGKVTGSISPGQKYTESPQMNDGFDCDPTLDEAIDCEEVIHANQSITLTATPFPGYRFVRWVGDAPCGGSTSATCTVPYDLVGTYDETTSADQSSYSAAFEPIDPANPQPICWDDVPDGPDGPGPGGPAPLAPRTRCMVCAIAF